MKSSAFSLIELMVVIAIVAVLASVAVSSYKSYIISSKIGEFTPLLNKIGDDMIDYVQQHGVFPNAAQLGYIGTGTPANAWVQNSEAISPNIASGQVRIVDFDVWGTLNPASACGRIGLVSFDGILNSYLGIKENGTFTLQMYIIHKNGSYKKFIDYYTAGSDSGTWYPGAVNVFQDIQGDWTYWGNTWNIVSAGATCTS
jgi:prepilin-type N-terminal cleavage/methylation domain-containing protein